MIIVASDYDGTLAKDGWVTEENKKAIPPFRQKGGKIGVVTGRSLTIAYDIPRISGGLDFLICCTGALILDGEGKVLYHKTAPTGEMVRAAIYRALELGCTYFGVNHLMAQYAPEMKAGMEVDFSDMPAFDHCNARFPTPADADAFVAYIEETFPGYWRGYRNGCCVDMPPFGASKVDGIRRYLQLFENESPTLYVVGDNVNDIPMLTAFPSYAVVNGVEEAKAAADRVCPSVAAMLAELLP